MEGQAPREHAGNVRVINHKAAVLALLFGLAASALSQDHVDKSAPSERNTDLQFDFSVTNTGKLGTYRIIRLDTGETLATGLVGKDISPRTTLLNEFKAAGLPARTPVIIQVEGDDGSWATVDSIEVHYPPEPSDSRRYLDDAGYRGNFKVPDLDAPNPTPTPTPSPTPTASPTASATPSSSPSARGGSQSGKGGNDKPNPSDNPSRGSRGNTDGRSDGR
jgi:hypothetical protein